MLPDPAWITAVTLFAISTSVSPGPNNLLLVASGARFGFARTLPHVVGIAIGFPVMVLVVGLALGGVFTALPWLHDVLAVIGILYLLYLAWTLLGSAGDGPSEKTAARPIGFVEAALFQWVNPKAWIMATTAITAYTAGVDFAAALAGIVTIFGLVGCGSSALWAGAGTVVARWLHTPGRRRLFNAVLAAMLVASVLPIVLDLVAAHGPGFVPR
ncbi:LysE family translocator [uncultured Methylobacterium sp.]|uniref:LysE family translocator n=1 Tax=uncultured Methylobacterium sp. TaxID=157278 RepID=UPI00262673DF|nr:LysE family translocator [uncultured Methylobacterium sp.]